MQIEKYSDRLKTLIQSAQTLALRSGHQQLTPLHVLKALLEDEDRLAANLIEAAGGSAKQIALEVDIELGKLPKVEGAGSGQVYLAPETARLFDQAEQTGGEGRRFLCHRRIHASGNCAGEWHRCRRGP